MLAILFADADYCDHQCIKTTRSYFRTHNLCQRLVSSRRHCDDMARQLFGFVGAAAVGIRVGAVIVVICLLLLIMPVV